MPPYPLYGETTAIPGASQAASTLHTHSNKFPIEREVILSSADKNTKIPILQEYRRREGIRGNMATIAPDAPSKLVAWTNQSTPVHSASAEATVRGHQTYLAAPYCGGPHTGAVPRTAHDPVQRPKPATTDHHERLLEQANTSGSNHGPMSSHGPMANHGPLPNHNSVPNHGAMLNHSHVMNQSQGSNHIQVDHQLRHFPTEIHDERITMDHIASADVNDSKKETADDKNKAFPTRTYQTLKGIISSRFNKKEATELSKSNSSLVEPNTLNNMEKDVNKSLDNGVKEDDGNRSSVQEGAYARLSGVGDRMGSMGVVYAKVLDQSGQCVVNVETKGNELRSDMIHSTNQAVYAERNAALKPAEMVKSPPYLDRSYRNPNTSQYAKPNTQQPYSDGNSGIYMVMRQGGHQQYSATNPIYQHHSGQNGVSSEGGSKSVPHTPVSVGFSQQQQLYAAKQTFSPNAYAMGNGMEMKGGPIGPGLTYQQQPKADGYYDDIGKKEKSEEKVKKGGFRKSRGSGSGQSSDYDKANVDSGRGSAVSGQQTAREVVETSEESSTTPQGNDSEWVDLVETELRQILDPHVHHQSAPPATVASGTGGASTVSDSISSMTPPLPPLSPGGANASRHKLTHNASGVYSIKQDYGPIDGRKTSQSQGRGNTSSRFNWSKTSERNKSTLLGQSMMGGSVTDITSTTGTGLDSLLDDDVATSIATGDARAIRHQLEGLENMYSQVLQLLGVKRHGGGKAGSGYQPSDPRFNKRRFHGSVSSVPSSVSSRPIREKRRQDERKKVKDIKGINKRFQRLESHVVTLARSVAHLSSEMRTQHLMIQEMENIRSELSALRTHTLAATSRSQSMPRLTSNLASLPALTNPSRVRKLTKFFGDEPPLLRLFLKKLGYEKYASIFETEHVGMVELPYMSEDKLQSMGIPLGPRLRILQEAQVSVLTTDQLCVL